MKFLKQFLSRDIQLNTCTLSDIRETTAVGAEDLPWAAQLPISPWMLVPSHTVL